MAFHRHFSEISNLSTVERQPIFCQTQVLPKQGDDPNARRQTGCLNEGERVLPDRILRLGAIRLHSHAIQAVQGGEYQGALGSIWWSMEIDLILEWVHWWALPHDLCSLAQIRLSHWPQSCTGTFGVCLLLIKHPAGRPQRWLQKIYPVFTNEVRKNMFIITMS